MTTESREAKSPAVFLDRDGTIMREVNYCGDPARVEVFAGASEALRRLKRAGFKLIVITNQSGIARGYFTEADYRAVENELERQLGPDVIDATYFCADHPDAPSLRRKPNPGMIFEAEREHRLDLRHSFFLGDKRIDAECARNAGVRAILVQTGQEHHADADDAADWIAADLSAAADIILAHAV